MQIQVGFEMAYRCPQPTPMLLVLNIHHTRASDLVRPDLLVLDPPVPLTAYRDLFGNWCSRIIAPKGLLTLRTEALVNDSGLPDSGGADGDADADRVPARRHAGLPARQPLLRDRPALRHRLEAVRHAARPAGRGCRRSATSSTTTSSSATSNARRTRTAWEAYNEGVGVCRDYAHLAIAFCRCLNIPARYCTGYLGDIGMPPPYGPMDFAAWFEVYLGGRWYTFDARNNMPRIGRVLMARGRDATDVAISTTFGPNTLERFDVRTDEVVAAPPAQAA